MFQAVGSVRFGAAIFLILNCVFAAPALMPTLKSGHYQQGHSP